MVTQWGEHKGFPAKAVTAVAVTASLYTLLHLSRALFYFGISTTPVQHALIFLAFMLTLSFLLVPLRKGAPRDVLPWYDAVLILLSWASSLYGVIYYLDLQFRMASLLTQDVVAAIILIILIFEAVRRVLGLTLAAVMLLFLVYIVVAPKLPGALRGPSMPVSGWIGIGGLSDQGIPGIALQIAATIIFVFVFLGELLRAVGADEFFKNVAFGLTGRFRGGPAKASVLASGLFGSISGSTTANIASTGTFTIPIMKKIGYAPYYAGAVEAAASNGGQIMPPIMGAVAFIMAQILGIPYLKVVVAAILPALLYFGALFLMVHFEAAKQNLKGLPAGELPSVKAAVKRWWFCILPIALLIYLLVEGYTIETAALWSLTLFVPLIFVGKRGGENRLKMAAARLKLALGTAPITMLQAGVACAGIGIMMAALSITGVGLRLSSLLVDISGGSLLLLIPLTAFASFILGMGMGSIAAYIVVALMVAPALEQLGVNPMAAHLFVFYWSLTAFLTPPVCIGAIVAAAIAQTDRIFRLGWESMRLAFVGFLVPIVFVLKPALILEGPIGETALVFFLVIIGSTMLAAGLAGYLLRPATWWQRILLIGGGAGIFSAHGLPAIIGVLLTLPVIVYQIIEWRKGRSSANKVAVQ